MILYLELLGIGVGAYVLLAFLGWTPWRLLVAGRDFLPFVVAAPLFGLGLLSLFGWYWLEYGSGGMADGLPILLAIATLANGVVLLRLRGRFWIERPSLRGVLSVCFLTLMVFAGVAYHYQDGLRGELTTATLGNNDVASYSLISQNLEHGGFGDPGPVVGNDLGAVARVDASGAMIFLASTAQVSGLETYQTTVPIIGLAALLVALACASLAGRIVSGSALRTVTIGLAAIAPYLFVYNATMYFLSQALSIAPIIALLVVYLAVADRRHDRSEVICGIATIALLEVPVLLTYPHMAVLAQPLILGIAWIADGPHDLLGRAKRLAIAASAGLALAALAVLPALRGAIERANALVDVDAGWPLGLLGPLHVLGFQRFPSMVDLASPGPTSQRYLVETLIVGVAVVGATLILIKNDRRHAWLGGAATLAVFVSHRFVYQAEGYSYRQWKWVSFFQPILSTALVAVLCAGIVVLVRRYERARLARMILGVVVAVVWIGFLTVRAQTLTGFDAQWTRVDSELAGLQAVDATNLRVVNLDLAPYWETMWGVYFVAPVRSRLAQESYYGRSPQTARWTLRASEPGSGEATPEPTLGERPISPVYELACGRPPCTLRLPR